jgi:hypothetical protein
MIWIPALIRFFKPSKRAGTPEKTGTLLSPEIRRDLQTMATGTYKFERGPLPPGEERAKLKAAYEFELRQGIINRMHGLRAILCRVNCNPSLHRPACKAMKKDIEYLKEIIL